MSSSLVTIFDDGVEIGQYLRNYPGFGAQTFEPFELNGRWLALYSKNYTATRVMSLPDCRDLGGEDPHSAGFCPVDLFVPRYREVRTRIRDDLISVVWSFEKTAEELPAAEFEQSGFHSSVGPWKTLTTGFVAGCIWGQDTSWKLQALDLARADEGVIVRSERFGYIELPDGLSLGEAVQPIKEEEYPLCVKIIRQDTRVMETGENADL